jgi:hypothetical protein
MDVARRLEVKGRSTMSKDELVEAIGKVNDRETRKAREKDSGKTKPAKTKAGQKKSGHRRSDKKSAKKN